MFISFASHACRMVARQRGGHVSDAKGLRDVAMTQTVRRRPATTAVVSVTIVVFDNIASFHYCVPFS